MVSESPPENSITSAYRKNLMKVAEALDSTDMRGGQVIEADKESRLAFPNLFQQDAERAVVNLRCNSDGREQTDDGKTIEATGESALQDALARNFQSTINGNGFQSFIRDGDSRFMPEHFSNPGGELLGKMQNAYEADAQLLRVVMGDGNSVITMNLPTRRLDRIRHCPVQLAIILPDQRAEAVMHSLCANPHAAIQTLANYVDPNFGKLLKLRKNFKIAVATMKNPMPVQVQRIKTGGFLKRLLGGG